MKVAFFDIKKYDIDSFEKYKKEGMEFKYYEAKLNLDTVELANGYDGVCIFVNDHVNKAVIDKLVSYNLKFIALRCAGFNNVDVKYAFEKIHVVRVPAYSPYAVAEHAIAMLLTSIRRIHKAYIRTRDFNFNLNGLTGFDLYGKTIGVIGTGKIGRVFINICLGFGMKVLAYDKYPTDDEEFLKKVKYVSLDELFDNSDIISLHCPLTEETKYIINKKTIKKCKDGFVLINTSRGALVDSEALLEGIKSRKIGAACLDVYEEEADFFFEDYSGHIMEDDILARLLSMPNVIITSHQAFLTVEALNNIAQTSVNNMDEIFKNNKCDNEVCFIKGDVTECNGKKCF